MANLCDYEIHAKGTKKAALMIYASMPAANDKEITEIRQDGDDYIVCFVGDCKWSLDSSCEPFNGTIDLEAVDEDDFDEDCGLDYWNISLKQKSALLHCEIEARAWSEESEFDGFEHYKDGVEIRNEYIHWSGEIVWDKDEYPSYEEFCNNYGIDPKEIPENLFEEEDENLFVYEKYEKKDAGIVFEFDF